MEKLLVGLRGQLQKDEHVLWQGRGSGRAFTVFNRALLLRFVLLAIAVGVVIVWMLTGPNQANSWVAWALVAILAARVALFVWQSSNTPSRQVATPTRLSPSSSFIAIRPEERTFLKSDRRLRRIVPAEVAKTSWRLSHSPSSSGSGRKAVMVSPLASGSRLTSALPRACGLPSGRRQTLRR